MGAGGGAIFYEQFSEDFAWNNHWYTHSKSEALMSLAGIVPQEFEIEFCYLLLENIFPIPVLHGKPAYQNSVVLKLEVKFGGYFKN